MNTPELPSTLRQLRKTFTNKTVLLSYLAVTAMCIIAGPFSTYQNVSLGVRIPYWAGVVAFCFVVSILLQQLIIHGKLHDKWPIPARILTGLVIAVIIAVFLFALNTFVFGDIEDLPGLTDYLALTVPISLAITGLIALMYSRSHLADIETLNEKGVTFLRRLPVHLGQDLYYLSVQDHYVEAVTAKGSHLVLMRFGDAVEELDGLDGLQIHRSHWIAKSAVTGVKRENGKLLVEMRNGIKLPISRSRLAEVKAALQLK